MRLLRLLAVGSLFALTLSSTAEASPATSHVVGLVNACAPMQQRSPACVLGVEARTDANGGVSGHLVAQGALWNVVELVQYTPAIWCLSAVPRTPSPAGVQRLALGFSPGTGLIQL